MKNILIILSVMALAAALMLSVDLYKARKSDQEIKRMNEVRAVVMQKVEAYYQATGHYPDSIEVLAFTNSTQELEMSSDLKKIRYRRTPTNYAIGWDGVYGYSR